MTLILSVITPGYVMQASDRCVTAVDEQGQLVGHEDERNKALFVAERFSFAFTGAADVDRDTADFVAARLGEALGDGKSLDEALAHTGAMLSDHFRSARTPRPLALVGVGWSDDPLMAQRTPCHVWTSNCMDERGVWLDEVSTTFETHREGLPDGAPFSLKIAGVPLDENARSRLWARLATHIAGSDDPDPTGAILVEAIREEADVNPLVGHGVMVNTLPITPGPPDQIMLIAGPPRLDVRTFAYVAPGGFDNVLLGPSIVMSNGGQMGGFRAEGGGLIGPGGGTSGIGYSPPGAPPPPRAATGQRISVPRPKRNDPCWCGSGKKYKKCHGP